MLARYRIHRGKRPESDPLPEGVRQDTRKHTKHCLRPTEQLVETYLDDATDAGWKAFEKAYREILRERYAEDPGPFEKLAAIAEAEDVYIGCSCPTNRNPDVNHCHTVVALRFMKERYPKLKVAFPK
ncbi:MAG: hypothetical protein CMJ18_24270 [Phycisphaeraceae bacterium]|nr:hypothetical protein [Phycisphaeraceae bacterium]